MLLQEAACRHHALKGPTSLMPPDSHAAPFPRPEQGQCFEDQTDNAVSRHFFQARHSLKQSAAYATVMVYVNQGLKNASSIQLDKKFKSMLIGVSAMPMPAPIIANRVILSLAGRLMLLTM